jgi:hypothetical protein
LPESWYAALIALPSAERGDVVGEDVSVQAQQVFNNLTSVLEEAGITAGRRGGRWRTGRRPLPSCVACIALGVLPSKEDIRRSRQAVEMCSPL